MKRKRNLIIANWKMYKTIAETVDFITGCRQRLRSQSSDVGLAVPFTALHKAAQAAADSGIIIGAQNMNDAPEGPFTGEISAMMLQEAGASFVILGHSERRRLFGEDNALVNRKVLRALESGLRPILCVGEMTEQHQQGQQIVREQLQRCLEGVTDKQLAQCAIAYEPVWAIGTGLSASPEYVGEVQQMVRRFLRDHWGEVTAGEVRILYGGSVTSDNTKSLIEVAEVDGLLVGGASLFLASFMQIIDNASGMISNKDELL